jgi:hypothetical protein
VSAERVRQIEHDALAGATDPRAGDRHPDGPRAGAIRDRSRAPSVANANSAPSPCQPRANTSEAIQHTISPRPRRGVPVRCDSAPRNAAGGSAGRAAAPGCGTNSAATRRPARPSRHAERRARRARTAASDGKRRSMVRRAGARRRSAERAGHRRGGESGDPEEQRGERGEGRE